MSETILRSRFLLSTIFSRDGDIDDKVLRDFLSLRTVRGSYAGAGSEEPPPLKKSEITAMLLRTIPPLTEDMPLNELLQLSIGLVAVLSIVGVGRKETFILRELLQRLTPSLIQARKVGAAEMGIHPDAGLWSLGKASDVGFVRIERRTKSLLRLVGAIYATLGTPDEPSKEGIGVIEPSLGKLRSDGNLYLKIDILKSCIAMCEVLPDYGGVLHYSLCILRLARGAILVPFGQPAGGLVISQDEQVRLISGIKRSVGAAAKTGQSDLVAGYWDDCLVRGIEALEPPAALRVVTHAKGGLKWTQDSKDNQKKDPFIYKPSTVSNSTATAQPLVADELAYFGIYLQNPLEVEIDIDEIRLVTEGCDFSSSRHSIVLGRFCCQKFTLTGMPKGSGILRITGCWAKVRCCEGREFNISAREKTSASVTNLAQSAVDPLAARPKKDTVDFVVLAAQPVVSLESTTLSQPALMLLEGETKRFEIVLKNESRFVDADLVLFNFEDSATDQLRTALKNQDLSPSELYELQLQLSERTPLKHVGIPENAAQIIPAGGTAKFTIEILGLPGLLQSLIQIEYASLGMDFESVKDQYHTRQLSLCVGVTVNAAIEAPRCNIHRFSKSFAWHNKQQYSLASTQTPKTPHTIAPEVQTTPKSSAGKEVDMDQFASQLAQLEVESRNDDYCLLSADVRNAWPSPLVVSLRLGEIDHTNPSAKCTWRPAYTIDESLQPGQMSRIVVLIPRLYVAEPHASIPLIGTERQYVVSETKSSVQAEQAIREGFWYREELLKRLRGTWREIDTGRQGRIDLRRGIRLNSRMIDALKIEEIEIKMSIVSTSKSGLQGPLSFQEGHSLFVLRIDSFASLSVRVQNHSAKMVHAMLRIRPSVRDQPHNIALDLSKRLAWTGILQQALHPALGPGETREICLGIMALSVGEYEIGARVEELRASAQVAQEMDSGVRSHERRTWHAREPCLIDAVDDVRP